MKKIMTLNTNTNCIVFNTTKNNNRYAVIHTPEKVVNVWLTTKNVVKQKQQEIMEHLNLKLLTNDCVNIRLGLFKDSVETHYKNQKEEIIYYNKPRYTGFIIGVE